MEQRRRAGRKKSNQWRVTLLLLDQHDCHQLPSPAWFDFLTTQGLGIRKVILDTYMQRKDLEDYIVSAYPTVPLKQCGFDIFRSERNRRLYGPILYKDADHLKSELKKGNIYIKPKTTIIVEGKFPGSCDKL